MFSCRNRTSFIGCPFLSQLSKHFYKSIVARYWPVSYPDGLITALYKFIKNAYWEAIAYTTHHTIIFTLNIGHHYSVPNLSWVVDWLIDWLGFNECQPLWVILCHLPEKGRKEIEELVEEMKEKDREERGTGMKTKKQKKLKHSSSTLTCYKDSWACPTVSQYQLDAPGT